MGMKSSAHYYCEFKAPCPMTEASLQIGRRWRLFKSEWWFFSHQQSITLSLYTLSHPPITISHQTMASNDNKRKAKEDTEFSATMKKRLPFFDDEGDDNSFGELEEETEAEAQTEEEVSSKESSMNQLDTFEEKLMAKCGRSLLFSDDDPSSSTESESRSLGMPSSHVCSDPDGSDNDDVDDFWM
jgi:hypothetical protein